MKAVTYSRHDIPYQNLSEAFRVKTKDFGRQYSHIYFARLMKYQPILEESIKKKWGKYLFYSNSFFGLVIFC